MVANALVLLRAAVAAVEPAPTQRAVLICVFRGSSHAEHAEAFSLDLDNAGITNKVEHSARSKYSEVRVNVKSSRTGTVASLKTTIRLLDKHHGLFIRYFYTIGGINDVECAPRDFNKSDFAYMLQHGAQEDKFAQGAAEPIKTRSGSRQFDFCFWHRLTDGRWLSGADAAATLAEFKRIVAPTHARVDEPMQVRRFASVPEGFRVQIRVTTDHAKETLALLIKKLPEWPSFIAFCNDIDSDDSFIPATDRQGLRALVQEFLEDYN